MKGQQKKLADIICSYIFCFLFIRLYQFPYKLHYGRTVFSGVLWQPSLSETGINCVVHPSIMWMVASVSVLLQHHTNVLLHVIIILWFCCYCKIDYRITIANYNYCSESEHIYLHRNGKFCLWKTLEYYLISIKTPSIIDKFRDDIYEIKIWRFDRKLFTFCLNNF